MPNEARENNKTNYTLLTVSIFILGSLLISYYPGFKIPRINEEKLLLLLQEEKVERIVMKQGEGLVHIFLKKEKEGWLSELKGINPDYILPITSSLVFDNHYEEIKNKLEPSQQISYEIEESSSGIMRLLYMLFLYLILPLLLLFFFFSFVGGGNVGGGGVFGLGKSKAKFWNKEKDTGVTFDDVIGMQEPKKEVMEIVDFFKKSNKFDEMGAKPPKGILLFGPPGTGKTLLARAVAGETKVQFIYTSGPDFIDMFMGVGAMRVQNLFEEARKNVPCIIFIDEIDAIGRRRSRSTMPGNQDGDNTLNQFLTEMDGFTQNGKIIIIGATNRLNVIDPALLRPGRFDRKIAISLPRIEDRKKIFKHYIGKLPKVHKNVNITKLAELTPLLSPASIANICNEAAIHAVRKGKEEVDMKDFEEATDREIAGIKRSMNLPKFEKEIISYHEVGHALVSWFLEHAAPLVKITIMPRGEAALGFAQYQPEEKVIYQEKQFLAELAVLLGGRAAELIIYGEFSTGASNDLERATQMARNKIEVYGMSKVVGHVSYKNIDDPYRVGKPYSEETAALIDKEVKRILDQALKQATDILTEHKETLEKIAKILIKKEVLYKKDLVRIVGARPFAKEEKKYKK